MNRFNALTVAVLYCLVCFTGCKSKNEDPKPLELTEQENVAAILTSGTWSPASSAGITLAEIDVTSDYFAGFTLRFTSDRLFTTGTTPVWLRQDTWRFKDNSSDIIIRGQDDKEITIIRITDTELKLALEWTETTYGGKTNSLPGTYTFTLTK